LYRYF